MKKFEKKSLFIILSATLLCVMLIGMYFLRGHTLADTIKFKKEYEAYNDKIVNNNKYIPVQVKSSDRITYVAEDELLEKMNNETAVFYFGFPTCPWCRNMIEPLLKTTKENNVTLYYFNPSELRTGNSDTYQKLMKKLKNYLSKNEDGKEMLYVPDVYFIKDGKIVANHLGTVNSQKDPFIALTEKEEKELIEIYNQSIAKMK